LGDALQSQILEIIPILEHFGIEEHFMTDYGDESTRTDPWRLFQEEDAREALEMAEKFYRLAEAIYGLF
jgi:HEPN domain-containing protein